MPLVRLLGPVDVVDSAGVVHAPNSPIRATILALLALDTGHTIDAEHLLHHTWNGQPPDSGLRALRFHISRLRAELCTPDLITTTSSGYQLNATTDINLVQHGLDTNTDLAPLLTLWRGTPLTNCSHTTTIEHEQQRLAELHLTLAEHHYQQRLDTADTTIIGDLTRLCWDHPVRESLWAILITAHYRAGNQAEALRTLTRLRINLRDELGVDPSPEIQRLEQQVLAHASTLTAPVIQPERAGPDHAVRSHNLPAPRRHLIGRDTELDLLVALTNEHQVVTVTGVGGVGKTSLALAAAHRLASHPDQEVWWCDLAPARGQDVAFRVGQHIGLATGVRDPTEVARALGLRRNAWLILDNCEHVVEAASAMAERVVQNSDARVIATSRSPLIADAPELPLAPLDAATTAVEMFVDVARRLNPETTVSANAELVRSICMRVGGIPLAIELVAARTRSLSLADIDRRLQHLLASAPTRSSTYGRYDTMSAAIAGSVELLDSPIAAALGALAVFEGGFDLVAAEAVLAGEADDPFRAIEELTAASLVVADTTGASSRYRLLEPIRNYAREHLWGDQARTRDLHLTHFIDRLEAAYATFGTSSCHPLLALVEHDIDNLTAVHDWALETGRIGDDLRLYRPMTMSWIHEWTAPRKWADETITIDGIDRWPGWAAVLCLAWVSAVSRYDLPRADELAVLGETIADDDPAIDCFLTNKGFRALVQLGDPRLAAELLEKADRGDPHSKAHGYYWRGLIPTFVAATTGQGLGEAARTSTTILDEGILWARSIGAANFEAALEQMMAQVLLVAGRVREARAHALRALDVGSGTKAITAAQQASAHLVEAALLGAGGEDEIDVRLVECIETAIRSGTAPRLAGVLKIASRPLAAHGRHHVAALCFEVPALGSIDLLPRLALDDIAPDVWEQAAAEAEHLSIFEIARLAADALRELTDTTTKEQV